MKKGNMLYTVIVKLLEELRMLMYRVSYDMCALYIIECYYIERNGYYV